MESHYKKGCHTAQAVKNLIMPFGFKVRSIFTHQQENKYNEIGISGLMTCAVNQAQYHGYKYALIYRQVKTMAGE